MIKSYGPQSPIMIVFDFPTKDEVRGVAGEGSCGNFLDGLLRNLGTSISQIYRTLLIKEYVPLEAVFRDLNYKTTNKFFRKTLKERFDIFGNLLIEEINLIKPNVVIACGELALNFLTDENNIDKFRGSILSSHISTINPSIKIIPIKHPREIFNDYKFAVITLQDLKRAWNLRNYRNKIDPDYTLWIARTSAQLDLFLARHKNPKYVSCDIEYYLGFITCVGLCCDGKEAISCPWLSDAINLFDESLMRRTLKQFLCSGVKIIGQNYKFDEGKFNDINYKTSNIYADTMLASHTIYSELPRGLDFLTSIYTTIPYYKDEGKEFDPRVHNFDRLYYYNALDTLADWRVWEAQEKELEEMNLTKFFFNGPMRWFHTYKKMESNGICIDETKRFELELHYTNEYKNACETLSKAAGRIININAPQQIAHLLYHDMEIEEQKHFKTGEITTEEDAIEYLILNIVKSEEVKNILNLILYGRKTYGIVRWLQSSLSPDRKMHTVYNLCGAESGRTSTPKRRGAIDYFYYLEGKNIKRKPYGIPFQTIPKRGFRLPNGTLFGKELISIFVPSSGYVFCEGDLSQAEARIVALLAEDWELLEDFDRSGGYVHKKTASWIFDCAIESIKKPSYEYDMGKRGRHAAHYDQTKFGLSKIAQISIDLADIVINTIHKKSPNIQNVFHRKIRDELNKIKPLINPFGRRRDHFGNHKASGFYREGYAQIPQSTVTDALKFAMIRIEEKCSYARFLIESHDSLLAEVPEESYLEYLHILKKECEQPIDFREGSFYINHQLVIPMEISWSLNNWMEMEEVKF